MYSATRRLLALTLAAIVLAGCSGRAPVQAGSSAPTTSPVQSVPVTAPPAPTPVALPPAAHDLPGTLLVMVENSFDARPQSGLDLADQVIEMNGDAGITRFLSVFYQHKAEKIGPVRSARMYFYEVAKAFQAPYAHAGANNDVLAVIGTARKGGNFPDIDDIYGGGGCFWRSTDRQAPHNLYTSTDKLLTCAQERKQAMTPLQPLPQGEQPGGKSSHSVTLSFGGDSPDIGWRWQDGRYLRSQNGEPHVMQSGAKLGAENLVVLWAPHKWFKPADDEWEWKIDIIGSGKARFFRDGKTYAGTWSKATAEEPFVFTGEDGALFHFAPGTVWTEVLKDGDPLSFEGQ